MQAEGGAEFGKEPANLRQYGTHHQSTQIAVERDPLGLGNKMEAKNLPQRRLLQSKASLLSQ